MRSALLRLLSFPTAALLMIGSAPALAQSAADYELPAERVEGGASAADAAELTPGTQADVSSFSTGETKTYRFDLEHRQTGFLTVASPTTALPANGSFSRSTLRVEISSPEDETCSVSAQASGGLGSQDRRPRTAVMLTTGPIGAENSYQPCLSEPGTMLVEVEHAAVADEPLEITLVIQDPDAPDTMPAPDAAAGPEALQFLPEPAGQSPSGAPGDSPTSAGDLRSRSVSGTIAPKSEHYYRVPVSYGQRLRARLDLAQPAASEDAEVSIVMLNAMGAQLPGIRPGQDEAPRLVENDVAGDMGEAAPSGAEATVAAINAIAPLSSRNVLSEDSDASAIARASVGGYAYLVVRAGSTGTSFSSDDDDGAQEYDYRLSWDGPGQRVDPPTLQGLEVMSPASALTRTLLWGAVALGSLLLVGAIVLGALGLRRRP